jgi:hypothetical protein
MIFKCGKTDEQIVKENSQWHRFFTILPRIIKQVDGYNICVFMGYIERRRHRLHIHEDGGYWISEYRELQK